MGKRIEVKAGDRFGEWTALGEGKQKGERRTITCRCKCGLVKDVNLKSLTRGDSKQCGKCGRMNRVNVKNGQIFGHWEVIKEVEPRITKGGRKSRMIRCKCKCGKVQDNMLHTLTTGNSTQCRKCGDESKIIVSVNDKFGDWTVLGEGKKIGVKRYIICQCKCGLVKEVCLYHLRHETSKQCRECSIKEMKKNNESINRNYRISKGLDPDACVSERSNLERQVFINNVRTKIYIRDDGKCQMCFKNSENVHHIIPWSSCHKIEDQNLRYDPENCISLCKECHLKAHDGNYKRLDNEIAEQLMTKAIENTEKHPELFKGIAEEINKKLEEIS